MNVIFLLIGFGLGAFASLFAIKKSLNNDSAGNLKLCSKCPYKKESFDNVKDS